MTGIETNQSNQAQESNERSHWPVRRKIENDSTVPLLSDWFSVTSLDENKADIAFLNPPD